MKRAQVWKCGGGTQSVAIAALICQGRLPKPDVSVIVDTGREKQSTWDYYHSVLVPNLSKIGVFLNRVMKNEWEANCRRDVWGSNGTLMIPAFSNQSGDPSKLSNFCSGAWKQEVADRWLSHNHRLTPSKRRNWLGFSLDEPRRWLPHAESEEVWLPLVHGVPMRREGCRSLVIREMGWPEPPRSNCWMCPNQSDAEWLEVRQNRPHEFDAAVLLEREIRLKDPHAYLHRQCVPLDEVDWSKPPDLFERACGSGECFV